ncbi:CobW family GTP-binding protein [Ferviditalea candida]|uniref:GTP-binding protein n=1 Tax=Ferviditalea candida TaxID=3108399 RepID=A0ABU5ZHT6_9BACL|nr:GTP-binding protein [Paenibacillaceae bacterium T2]
MKRPVTIFTGFLGSGKSTLLARILEHPSMRHTAVLVNEFGKVGLDHHLLRRVDEHTVLLGGGCLCCTVRDDLVKALKDLLGLHERGEISQLDRVIIETSGLADPAPILFTILSDPVLQHHYFVDGVIATVDAVNGPMHLELHPESVKQFTVADKVIITKTDIAAPDQINRLHSLLAGLNPSVTVMEAVFGNIEPEALLKTGPTKLRKANLSAALPDPSSNGSSHSTEPRSISLTFDKPLDWTAFGLWLSMLLYAHGRDVLRVKGMVDVGEAGPVILNGVQHIIHPPDHLEQWPGEDRRSHIIFIMKSLEPLDILSSLKGFQHLVGAKASMLEMDVRI